MACSRDLSHPDLVQRLAVANAKFAGRLFRLISSSSATGNNLFLSPCSVLTLMAMTFTGARNKTAAQMESALGLSELKEDIHLAFKEYRTLLTGAIPGCLVTTATKMCVRKDKVLSESFLQKAKCFGAEAELCDFVGNPEMVCSKVNSWIAEETRNLITNVLSPYSISADTSLLLIDAIYFKGTWDSTFDPELTQPETFNVSASKKVSVDMMHNSDLFEYSALGSLKATVLKLPYKQHNLVMVILLPYDVDGLGFVEENVDLYDISSMNFQKEEVDISLPQFKMESSLDLEDHLKALGMPSAFDPTEADFTGMDPSGLLTLSKVLHRSCVVVNESGTEAAACTVMDCCDGCTMTPPRQFVVDHPFMFFIKDNRSEMILFVGKMVNPKD